MYVFGCACVRSQAIVHSDVAVARFCFQEARWMSFWIRWDTKPRLPFWYDVLSFSCSEAGGGESESLLYVFLLICCLVKTQVRWYNETVDKDEYKLPYDDHVAFSIITNQSKQPPHLITSSQSFSFRIRRVVDRVSFCGVDRLRLISPAIWLMSDNTDFFPNALLKLYPTFDAKVSINLTETIYNNTLLPMLTTTQEKQDPVNSTTKTVLQRSIDAVLSNCTTLPLLISAWSTDWWTTIQMRLMSFTISTLWTVDQSNTVVGWYPYRSLIITPLSRLIVQVAGHVSGQAFYYRRSDVDDPSWPVSSRCLAWRVSKSVSLVTIFSP